jgi:hypothetical protein
MMRRSIFLPIGATIQHVTSATAVQVFEDQILGMTSDSSGNVSIIAGAGNNNNPALIVVACGSLASALSFISQIQNFMASSAPASSGPFTPVVYIINSYVFTNVLPSSWSLADGPWTGSVLNVVGTGLNLLINAFKLDDGGGDVSISVPGSVQFSDGPNLVCNMQTPLSVVGAYVLYYSTDNGSSWITTGLTMTVTP